MDDEMMIHVRVRVRRETSLDAHRRAAYTDMVKLVKHELHRHGRRVIVT